MDEPARQEWLNHAGFLAENTPDQPSPQMHILALHGAIIKLQGGNKKTKQKS